MMIGTKKLLEAIYILADERFFDTDPIWLKEELERQKIEQQQIYSAMNALGYLWRPNKQRWQRKTPAWFERVQKGLEKYEYEE